MNTSFRCWAEIEIEAMRANLRTIRSLLASKVRVIAVVKADAYGSDGAAADRRGWKMPPELAVLTVLAAVTRLTAITHPRAIVFDEVYFREDALRYLCRIDQAQYPVHTTQ